MDGMKEDWRKQLNDANEGKEMQEMLGKLLLKKF